LALFLKTCDYYNITTNKGEYMSITREDYEELTKQMEILETALYEIDYIVRNTDKSLYERWKAYGKAVTSEFVSMGPSLPEVIEKLGEDIVEEDEDLEDDTDSSEDQVQ
jgi:hypothetical protein